MATEDQTINVPQLILVLVLSGLAIRYFFFSASSSSSNPGTTSAASIASRSRAREADVERIQQMFPQVQRRNVMWDLQRNGGSVASTTERILSGRGLDEPPPTFQPPIPVSSLTTSTTSGAAAPRAALPDLITRYNLSSKITAGGEAIEKESGSGTSTPGKKEKAWSSDAGQRQSLLQKRREEMILEARRKMEAKLKAGSEERTA